MLKDPLTSLYNRYYLEEHLESILDKLNKQCTETSVAFIDIDNFKIINDSYGHVTGDELLKALGEEINNRTRKTDYAFRYGGHEFLIVYPNTKPETALDVTKRMSLSRNWCIRPKFFLWNWRGTKYVPRNRCLIDL